MTSQRKMQIIGGVIAIIGIIVGGLSYMSTQHTTPFARGLAIASQSSR
jgi:hypothetical protein